MLAVNTLAPYLLTWLIERPERLIYLTSDMHISGDDSLNDLDWDTRRWDGTQAYRDSKLFVTTLALAAARRWADVISHAVDPSIRNASDPQMDGPDLNTEKQQAAAIYERYGYWTTIGSAITCWAAIARLTTNDSP
jgi:hypothetical protein